ncbi:MAG: hypothetical protein MI921_10985 [Cytophagales bacterium]|nr:hypothetical protein [Cytophagales bacterium]
MRVKHLLAHFSQAQPLTSHKAEVLEGVKQTVEEMKLINAGKLKGTPAKDLLDEL